MANHDQLRSNKNQHVAKNTLSKNDDKAVKQAMDKTITYLEEKFNLDTGDYRIEHNARIDLKDLIQMIKLHGKRKADTFSNFVGNDPYIIPDGGALILKKLSSPEYQKLVLVVEMKRQGTNDKRKREGKPEQAQGNAIERLGKNLTGIRAALRYEPITPFVCFGWGVDFAENSLILNRVITMNEFYPLNKTHVNKQDDGFSPVSMYFREKQWEIDEIFEIIKEIAETSIRRYIH